MDGLSFKGTPMPVSNTGIGGTNSVEISGGQRRVLNQEIAATPSLQSTGQTGSFAETLGSAIGEVNALQKNADKAIQNLATGRTDNIADVMVQTEQADIALKLMMQVRNKIIDAYQEVMKMQV